MPLETEWHYYASNYQTVPYFSADIDTAGFASMNQAMPPHSVSRNLIQQSPDSHSFFLCKPDSAGMIWRTHTGKGFFHIEAEVSTPLSTQASDFLVLSVNGMDGKRLLMDDPWDAAGLVLRNTKASWTPDGNRWSYDVANPLEYLDIEIEPKHPSCPVYLHSIHITRLPNRPEPAEKPTLYLLGDSTVKSYVFEEAPMSSYGQILPLLFDREKIRAVNYSNGGRSFKIMHIEGRFNDMIFQARPGDFLFLQSGHNDERNDDKEGPQTRYGRGATQDMYEHFLRDYYLTLARIRGVHVLFITPMTRFRSYDPDTVPITDSFASNGFPDVMRKIGQEEQVPVLDLNKKSLAYLNQIGHAGARAVTMALEPGETPGKTNGGSYANGNPADHMDGTHYKEALSKQYARLLLEELRERTLEEQAQKKEAQTSEMACCTLFSCLREDVKNALQTHDWHSVFPEVCLDVQKGENAYYRNQIEKIVQLHLLEKDCHGNFHPKKPVTIGEFSHALQNMWNCPNIFPKLQNIHTLYSDSLPSISPETLLTREIQAFLIYKAYESHFGFGEDQKPPYMTDYNGTALSVDDPNFDPNLPQNASQYYPTVAWDSLLDTAKIHPAYYSAWKTIYPLGLLRSETDIRRGCTKNGRCLEPQTVVTREKAAKSLFFLWILGHPVKTENHVTM